MTQPVELEKKPGFMSEAAFGTLLCVLSDVLFSVAYVFVQFINKLPAEIKPSGDWMLCFKEWIAAAFAIPIFLYLLRQGKTRLPGIRVFLMLLVATFFCEYVGITHHFMSYDFIGMAMGLPVIRTVTILGCTIFGALLLREKITVLKVATVAVLVGATVIFGYCLNDIKKTKEAEKAAQVVTSTEVVNAAAVETPAEAVTSAPVPAAEKETSYYGISISKSALSQFGFYCAFITGLGYAIYTLILRVVLRKANAAGADGKPVVPVSIYYVVSVVFGFGGLFGAVALLLKNREQGLAAFQAAPQCWGYILAAGVLTFFAFYFKNLSLRYATASKVATLSVVQILCQVMFGILIFHDPTNAFFWAGVGLTVLGILLASRTN